MSTKMHSSPAADGALDPRAPPAKQQEDCGGGFLDSSGVSVFNALRESGDLADVTVGVRSLSFFAETHTHPCGC